MFVHVMPHEAWQLDALAESIRRVGQRGRLVVRGDAHPEWHPERHLYPILDRVMSFHRAMLEHVGDEPVAILDPDMLLLRPLEPVVGRGLALGTRHQVMYDAGIAWQMSWAVGEAAGTMQLVDWPVVLEADDARRLAPLWLDITERAVADPSLRSLFGWMLDMYAYAAAARYLEIAHDVRQAMRVVPGMQERIGDAWVIHYHHIAHGLDKRTYVPGMRFAPHPRDEAYNALREGLEIVSNS